MKKSIIIGVAIAILLVGCAAFAVCATSDVSESPDMTTADSGDVNITVAFTMMGVEAPDSGHVNSEVYEMWISCDGYTRLKYSTSTGNGLKVINYDGDDKDYIKVPDYVVYNGETYIVDEIGYAGLSTLSPFGRHPVNVELGPNITTIGVSAFDCGVGINNMYYLTFRDIENSKLEYIDSYAFDSCRISALELPSSVTYIGQEAFSESAIADLTFNPNGFIEVGPLAFYECTKLKSFPFEMVSCIGYSAFKNCKNITEADLENCKDMGHNVFKGSGVKHVKFGYVLEHIEDNSFEYDFYYGNGNKFDYNDPSSFWGKEFVLINEKYVDATANSHVNSKVSDKWISADGYTRLKYSTSTGNGLKVIDYDGDDKKFISVPDYVVYNGETYVVDEIGKKGLSTSSPFGRHPVNVELGPNIVAIGEHAIHSGVGINNVYSVTFRDIGNSKLEYIGLGAFKCCRFTALELPSSVTYIGNNAFYECSLADLTFNPVGLVEVCKSAFDGCKNLKGFPFEMASSIGYSAFKNCKNITEADLENCKDISASAFVGTSVSHVEFGHVLEHIDGSAFDHDFYDAYGNKLDYNDPSSFWGKEFRLLGEKFVAVQ